MDLSFSDEDRRFRRELREWSRDNVPTAERPCGEPRPPTDGHQRACGRQHHVLRRPAPRSS